PRRLPADPGEPREGAEIGPRELAGKGLLAAGPAAEERQAGPGLRRLHLRRLPVRAGQTALPETAEPHRRDPRRALEAGPLLRRQEEKPGAAAVGDVRP